MTCFVELSVRVDNVVFRKNGMWTGSGLRLRVMGEI